MNGFQIYKFGEKGSGFRAPHFDAIQDYKELHDKCLRSGTLFEDNVFPPKSSSVFYSRSTNFEWKRPKEIVNNPEFIIEGASRFDICQGELGDCWLLAAIANLTLNKNFFNRVVPPDQSFSSNYAGIFHFRFWQYGKWIDIVIDDKLPTINGQLVFMHSAEKREFWSALVEKAYAKLHGSYEALKGGTATEAMTDFTGGLTEFYDLQAPECPPNLLSIMIKAYERSSFMGCSIDAVESRDLEAKLSNGLIKGHAYSVTAVKLVTVKTPTKEGKIPIVRIRNPWGNEAEWIGAWSDGSREWTLVSEKEKENLELNFRHDGEFWMSFQDFKTNFTKLEICNLTPEPLDSDSKMQWSEVHFDGAWISGVSAGGCRNHIQTFSMNPQYIISLTDYDEDDNDDLCTLIIGLMQKNRRAKRKMGLDTLTIGFAVYKLTHGHFEFTDNPATIKGFIKKQVLNSQFFRYNASIARSPNFINLREVCSRIRLPQGHYCVIPSTFDPHEEGEFLLRIFTEKPPGVAEENDDEIGLRNEEEKEENNKMEENSKEDVKEEEIVKLIKENGPQPDASNANLPNINLHDLTIDLLQLFISCWSARQNQNNQIQETQRIIQGQDIEKGLNTAQQFFSKIAGEDMEVDAKELRDVLNHALKKEFKFEGFSLDTCRSMVALLDDDRSGNLGMDEFILLWKNIRHWCSVFRQHDADNSGTISANELRSALNESGLNVNRHILQVLVKRYGEICKGKKGEIKIERTLTFDAFIACCLKLKYAIDAWNVKKSSAHTAEIKLDEWVESIMYC